MGHLSTQKAVIMNKSQIRYLILREQKIVIDDKATIDKFHAEIAYYTAEGKRPDKVSNNLKVIADLTEKIKQYEASIKNLKTRV